MAGPEQPVRMEVGFGREHRQAAANLYWDAFGLKLERAIGPRQRGVRLIERRLDPTRAVAALVGDQLAGLAGFRLDGRALTNIRVRDIVQEFGLWNGVRRSAWASILDRKAPADVLLMDGIVVRLEQRGRGIGTKLLSRICEVAAEHGKKAVRLSVVDTNPAAHRLYERMGFVQLKVEKVPWMRRFMGFSPSRWNALSATSRKPPRTRRGVS